MDFALKRTSELSQREQEQFCELFRGVYGKPLGLDGFQCKYRRWAHGGQGYHALMVDGDQLVGSFSGLPVRYAVAGRVMTLAVGTDSMIRKDSRGNLQHYRMLNELVYDALAADDIPLIFAFPNVIARPLLVQYMKWREIGRLHYYVRPVDLSGLYALGGPLSLLLRGLGRTADAVARLAPDREPDFAVTCLRHGDYPEHRYCMGQTLVHEPDGAFYAYDVMELGEQRICCLIDVHPLTRRRFDGTVRKVLRAVDKSVRAVAYVGRLPFRPWSMFRIPVKYEPRPFTIACKATGVESLDLEPLYDIANWNVGLCDFDLV